MRNLKQFNTHQEYEAAQSSLILPNVSICKDTPNEVHYNPYVEPIETRVVAKYNVTTTSNPTIIGYNQYTSGFSAIEIDGVMQPSIVSAYTFDTLGEHTVKYTLTDPTTIGYQAFWKCTSLTSINIPNSVTSIGDSAFEHCSGLTSVTIGSGVTSIGVSAFRNCRVLTSITIPNSVTSIGTSAFNNCSSLTSCTIGNSVTSIGNYAFEGCGGLTSIVIPNSVTSIGQQAFYQCSGLTSITVNSNNTVYDSRDNCNAIIETASNKLIAGCNTTVIPNSVTSIGYGAFGGCSSLTSIDIPSGVTSISNSAFTSCYGLTSCTIGSGVTSIGQYAFAECYGLTSITCNAMAAPRIQSSTFQYVKTNGTLYVPSSSSGYDTWMGTGNYYLGKYNWTKVEQ